MKLKRKNYVGCTVRDFHEQQVIFNWKAFDFCIVIYRTGLHKFDIVSLTLHDAVLTDLNGSHVLEDVEIIPEQELSFE